MTNVTYKGDDSYHSTDPWNGNRPVNVVSGGTVEVSEEKAAQLAADFPGLFDVDLSGEKKPKRTAASRQRSRRPKPKTESKPKSKS